jgi:hypothetical protein
MLLTNYLSSLSKVIDEYSKTGLILSSELRIDLRTEKIGLIKGEVIFLNESKLFFTEYLDLRYKVEKLTYCYHYQNKDNEMIFRYDNALHKPHPGFVDHKHVGAEIAQSGIPELEIILEEIISSLLPKEERKGVSP